MVDMEKIFLSLVGHWKFFRTVNNKLHPHLSGDVTGSANFNRVNKLPHVLHYQERGNFNTARGSSSHITQEYFYVLNHRQRLEIYFASLGKQDQLFHILNEQLKAQHQCGLDMYSTQYEFNMNKFSIHHTVKGPYKIYELFTTFKFVAPSLIG